MTAREKLIRDVLDLPEGEIEPVAEFIASRRENGTTSPARPAQPGKVGRLSFFAIGDGSPDNASERVEELVGEIIDRRHPRSGDERAAREFLIRAANGDSGLDLERLRSVRDRAWRIEETRDDGRLVLGPESSEPYPAVRAEFDGRPATGDEFAAFEGEHGPLVPPDGEG